MEEQHYRPQYYIIQLQVPHADIDIASYSKLQYKFTELRSQNTRNYTLAEPYNFRRTAALSSTTIVYSSTSSTQAKKCCFVFKIAKLTQNF